jgi:rubredoxin
MDFDMHCTVSSYSIVYVPKKGDPMQIKNTGSKFNANAMNLMTKAQQGDKFQFIHIRTVCPGDDMMPLTNTLDYTVNK